MEFQRNKKPIKRNSWINIKIGTTCNQTEYDLHKDWNRTESNSRDLLKNWNIIAQTHIKLHIIA